MIIVVFLVYVVGKGIYLYIILLLNIIEYLLCIFIDLYFYYYMGCMILFDYKKLLRFFVLIVFINLKRISW